MAEEKIGKVIWKGGMAFDGGAGSGPWTIPLDAEAAAGGADQGFRPMELLLVGLAGCTAMDVISILKKKQQDVTGFEVETVGARADEHPRVYTDIQIVYRVIGHNIDPKAVARAIELSETKYCPASAMLRERAAITSRYEIVEAASA